jgi:hypothetical protein
MPSRKHMQQWCDISLVALGVDILFFAKRPTSSLLNLRIRDEEYSELQPGRPDPVSALLLDPRVGGDNDRRSSNRFRAKRLTSPTNRPRPSASALGTTSTHSLGAVRARRDYIATAPNIRRVPRVTRSPTVVHASRERG